MRRATLAFFIGSFLIIASDARAQADGRWRVGVSGGAQTANPDFRDQVAFSLNAEDGDLNADYSLPSGRSFDVSAAARTWRRLTIGVSVSYFDSPGQARVDARLPHPLLFNRPRTVSGESELDAREIGVHMQAGWIVGLGERLDLAVSGGPSIVKVRRELVEQVSFSETFPFHTASFTGVVPARREDDAVGINLGAEVEWRVHPRFGIGAGGRYSRASVDLPSADGDQVTVDAGGVQLLVGFRARF